VVLKVLNRRDFLKTGGTLALAGMASQPVMAQAEKSSGSLIDSLAEIGSVFFTGDGLSLTPEEYCRCLAQLTETEDFERDYYATGGIIRELEQKFAQLLDKETAVFLPTGTMANHLALRRLTGTRKRVIVQADGHLYNDSGDCAQELSGLNLVPVEGEFSVKTITQELNRAASGPVKTEVGCILLESPLRRGFNTTHSQAEVTKISGLAREKGISLHLDGARMFMAAAHHGYSPAALAAPFDTVYVSLSKNFNAAGGAVLAGPKDTLADLLHDRRMVGGSPYNVWPLAAVAMLFVDDFLGEYRKAKAVTDQLINHLVSDRRFNFEKIPSGSNSFWLHLEGIDPGVFVRNLAKRNIHLIEPRPQWDGLLLMINPTISRLSADKLAEAFQAAGKS
jgi:threonine aldolase